MPLLGDRVGGRRGDPRIGVDGVSYSLSLEPVGSDRHKQTCSKGVTLSHLEIYIILFKVRNHDENDCCSRFENVCYNNRV